MISENETWLRLKRLWTFSMSKSKRMLRSRSLPRSSSIFTALRQMLLELLFWIYFAFILDFFWIYFCRFVVIYRGY